MDELVRVLRLHHLSVPRPRPAGRQDAIRGSAAEARRFYGGVLGLEEIAVPAPLAHLDLVWYRVGDDGLHLVRDERGARHTAHHFCVQVDDVAVVSTGEKGCQDAGLSCHIHNARAGPTTP